MTSDKAVLLKAILAEPDEDTPRLAYADALEEEHGPSEYTRLLRGNTPETDEPLPFTQATRQEYLEAIRTQPDDDVLKLGYASWLARSPEPRDQAWAKLMREQLRHEHRGNRHFNHEDKANDPGPQALSNLINTHYPIMRLHVYRGYKGNHGEEDNRALSGFRYPNLAFTNGFLELDAKRLHHATPANPATPLNLHCGTPGNGHDAGFIPFSDIPDDIQQAILTARGYVNHLSYIPSSVRENIAALTVEGDWRREGQRVAFPRVKTLRIDGNDRTIDNIIRGLECAPQTLNVHRQEHITATGFYGLLSSPIMNEVRSVDVGNCPGFNDNALADLLNSPAGNHLERLDVSHTSVTARGIKRLADSPKAAGLHYIAAGGSKVDRALTQAILQSKFIPDTAEVAMADSKGTYYQGNLGTLREREAERDDAQKTRAKPIPDHRKGRTDHEGIADHGDTGVKK